MSVAKGRKAQKQAVNQLNFQQLAEENPAIMKAFGTIIMVLEGLQAKEFETDMVMRGSEYHFKITKTSKPIIQMEA